MNGAHKTGEFLINNATPIRTIVMLWREEGCYEEERVESVGHDGVPRTQTLGLECSLNLPKPSLSLMLSRLLLKSDCDDQGGQRPLYSNGGFLVDLPLALRSLVRKDWRRISLSVAVECR